MQHETNKQAVLSLINMLFVAAWMLNLFNPENELGAVQRNNLYKEENSIIPFNASEKSGEAGDMRHPSVPPHRDGKRPDTWLPAC